MLLPPWALTVERPQPRPVYDNPPAISRRRGWLARLSSVHASGRASSRPARTAERLRAAG